MADNLVILRLVAAGREVYDMRSRFPSERELRLGKPREGLLGHAVAVAVNGLDDPRMARIGLDLLPRPRA